MGGMFDFVDDIGNHESRQVDRHEIDGMIIDTARVSDGLHPFETAVSHPRYNYGNWVIVESYTNIKEANRGHDKWVKIMTSEELPASLKDCGNALISSFGKSFGIDMEFPIDNGEVKP